MNSLCKLCRRNFVSLKNHSSVARYFSETFGDQHVYDRILPWKSNREFADYLCENIVYDSNGIIVLNKPYGVSFSKDGSNWQNIEKRDKKFTPVVKHRTPKVADPNEVLETNSGFIRDDKINLNAALPFIEDIINDGKPLRIVRVPEKYTSGVSLLARNEKVELMIKKCLERSKTVKEASDSYLAIVSGEPLIRTVNNLRIGIKLETSNNKKQKQAVLTTSYSKREVLRSAVMVATVNSTLLSMGWSEEGEGGREDVLASLVLLETNVKRWHFVRLVLATHLLAPALGDHMFGNRVKKVMGESVLIDHWSQAASGGRQKLDSRLLTRLALAKGSEMYIPTMIHHSSVTLEGLKGKALTLKVPPPDHFVWTALRLGLSMPPQYAYDHQMPAQEKQLHRNI